MPWICISEKSEPNHEAGFAELEALLAGDRAHRHAGAGAQHQRVRDQPVDDQAPERVQGAGQGHLAHGRLDDVRLRVGRHPAVRMRDRRASGRASARSAASGPTTTEVRTAKAKAPEYTPHRLPRSAMMREYTEQAISTNSCWLSPITEGASIARPWTAMRISTSREVGRLIRLMLMSVLFGLRIDRSSE